MLADDTDLILISEHACEHGRCGRVCAAPSAATGGRACCPGAPTTTTSPNWSTLPAPSFRRNVWTKALARSDLGFHATPHGLCNAHASWLLAGDADLQVVKERLGHDSITTTGSTCITCLAPRTRQSTRWPGFVAAAGRWP